VAVHRGSLDVLKWLFNYPTISCMTGET